MPKCIFRFFPLVHIHIAPYINSYIVKMTPYLQV